MKPLYFLAVALLVVPFLVAQPPAPKTYTINIEANTPDVKFAATIYRDGLRERIDTTISSGARSMKASTLFDFQTHKVYWLDTAGESSCSSGHYASARAPIDQDPITGGADQLRKYATVNRRKAAQVGTVNGIPARLEEFVTPTKPESPEDWRLTKLWVAEPGGFVAKAEGLTKDGRPGTAFEIKRLAYDKPSAALLTPPANCVVTTAEMDESGSIRAHAEATINAEGKGSVDLGTGKQSGTAKASSTVKRTSGTAKQK